MAAENSVIQSFYQDRSAGGYGPPAGLRFNTLAFHRHLRRDTMPLGNDGLLGQERHR